MSGRDKPKRKCPICEAEVDEDEEVCPECGCYLEEPAYDIEDDLGEQSELAPILVLDISQGFQCLAD